MRKSSRHPKHAVSSGGKIGPGPFFESRRAAAQIHDHVENFAGVYLDELALRLADQVVQPAQNVAHGERLIVLNEVDVEASRLFELAAVVALDKKAALVRKHPR